MEILKILTDAVAVADAYADADLTSILTIMQLQYYRSFGGIFSVVLLNCFVVWLLCIVSEVSQKSGVLEKVHKLYRTKLGPMIGGGESPVLLVR